MFDATFFEQFVPACIETMRDDLEVTGEVGAVVHLQDLATRTTTVRVPVKSIARVDLVTHGDNPSVTGKQRKFAGYISRRSPRPGSASPGLPGA